MNTTYSLKESPATRELKPVSVWLTQEFQRFAAIATGTALLLSLLAAFNLKADVDDLTGKKLPTTQSQMGRLQIR